MPQTIAVLDFGSQLTQVIARRIRECQVYSKIYHYATPAAKLREEGVIGIILSGGPQSVYAKTAPHPDPEIFKEGNRESALLFKYLATLRVDAPLFKDVEQLRWSGATSSFSLTAEKINDSNLQKRVAELEKRLPNPVR